MSERAIGCAPSEISALVNEPVVSRHAEEAAFLWTLRNRAIGEPHYSLDDLAALDERVEAHADGLRIAGEIGWRFAKENLVNEGPGEAFALAIVAFSAGNLDRMSEALRAGCASAKATPGLVSALGWLDHSTVSPWISRLLQAKSPQHRAVGIAASAIHRADPGLALSAAIADADAPLRARALRATGELKRQDLVNEALACLTDEDDACRFWAAWCVTLNGETSGLRLLTEWFERDDGFTRPALQVSLRALRLDQGRHWVSSLAKQSDRAALAVEASGIVGDPASVPWLIRRMESEDLARLAGEAFTMITGVDLAFHDLDRDAPASDAPDDTSIEEVIDLAYESNLPWPSPAKVADWWAKNGHTFSAGVRYLAGRPITPGNALEVLRIGRQRQRVAAALELSLLQRDRPLFEVRARGGQQQLELSRWTS